MQEATVNCGHSKFKAEGCLKRKLRKNMEDDNEKWINGLKNLRTQRVSRTGITNLISKDVHRLRDFKSKSNKRKASMGRKASNQGPEITGELELDHRIAALRMHAVYHTSSGRVRIQRTRIPSNQRLHGSCLPDDSP
jgi:hypothetical protein